MKLASPNKVARRGALAYSLVEVMIAVLIVAIVGISLYAGFTSGFAVVKAARENLRATQIMVKRFETLRLYTWSQVTNNSYLQPNFVALYDPLGQSNNSVGTVYVGKIEKWMPTNLPAAYQKNMETITITLYWTNYNGNKVSVRRRQIQSYVARYGIQPYTFGPPLP